MTQDQIIEMARQAGLHVATDVNWMPVIGLDYAKKLIELAAAKEREACAKIADEWAVGWPHPSKVIAEEIRARGQE